MRRRGVQQLVLKLEPVESIRALLKIFGLPNSRFIYFKSFHVYIYRCLLFLKIFSSPS